jgi:hypothetical protein
MILEILKITLPIVLAAIIRKLEKDKLRKKGMLIDEEYFNKY